MIGWALRASEEMDRNWRLRLKFVLAALTHKAAAEKLKNASLDSPMGSLLREWPDTVGYLLWPYQCAAWDANKRVARIEGHLDVLEQLPSLKLEANDKLVLLDLGSISADVCLMIDRAKWLSREGHLTLSLFKGDFRAFTLSFSLFDLSNLEVFVGGLQGRQEDGILSLYRDLTKDFHGIRPRDFMLEILRLFATTIGAKHIYAVADRHKISRHDYFGKRGAPGLIYDEVWSERGGVRVADTHFELSLAEGRRDLEQIASKKRSMYRRRYEMLDRITSSIPPDLRLADRRRFDAK